MPTETAQIIQTNKTAQLRTGAFLTLILLTPGKLLPEDAPAWQILLDVNLVLCPGGIRSISR